MNNFSKGDLVQLKSGGPRMTVIDINDDKVICQWFDDKQNLKKEESQHDSITQSRRGSIRARVR